jgi:tetraacyldisaccharide 4'-kinase
LTVWGKQAHNLEKNTLLCQSQFKKMLIKLSNGMKWVLWPLSLLYGLVTFIRNYAYDKGLKKVYQSSIYTINIGNLTVGGTGKTPHIEHLVRLLNSRCQLAILSRGYGRKTKGFSQANSNSTAREIGDEPLQLYQKFGKGVPVFVCEKRAEGLQKIEGTASDAQIILLDDAFQHRAILPNLNLLLTDYGRLFYKDHLLPRGLLRESKQGAKRAQAVIVTKCPELRKEDKSQIIKEIQRYIQPNTPVFFSTFEYAFPVPYFESIPDLPYNSTCWLVSGIAQPSTFEQAASHFFKLEGHSVMGDHHAFTEEEVRKWIKISNEYPVLTTEKDWVKIKPILQQLSLTTSRFYYWPIQVKFEAKDFDKFILNEVTQRFRV